MSQITGSILKEDSLGRVERLPVSGGWVLRRVACGGRVPLSGWLARRLLGRERRALGRVKGLPGFPQLLHSHESEAVVGPDGRKPKAGQVLVREYLDGLALHQAEFLPINFFDRLEELLEELHGQGVCHNDLHKEQNILVAPDGFPQLIDFQLASIHPSASRSFRVRCHEDLRHIQKHKRRYLRDGRGPEGVLPPPGRLPRKPLSLVWRKTVKPLYHFITRRVLKRWDGEARRESSGPWPRWTVALGEWADRPFDQ